MPMRRAARGALSYAHASASASMDRLLHGLPPPASGPGPGRMRRPYQQLLAGAALSSLPDRHGWLFQRARARQSAKSGHFGPRRLWTAGRGGRSLRPIHVSASSFSRVLWARPISTARRAATRWWPGLPASTLTAGLDVSGHAKDIDVLIYDKIRWKPRDGSAACARPRGKAAHAPRAIHDRASLVATIITASSPKTLKRARSMIFLCEHETARARLPGGPGLERAGAGLG